MRNFKLLLATTAILSTITHIVNAGVEGDPTGTGYARIEATATFTSPITARALPIDFGIIDPSKGGVVSVKFVSGQEPQVTDTNGAVLDKSMVRNGTVILSGGVIKNDLANETFMEKADLSKYVTLALDNEEIELTETAHSGGSNNGSGEICGTVDNITTGGTTYYTYSTGKELAIILDGTLHINNEYSPSEGYATCTGHTTVTYVMSYQF